MHAILSLGKNEGSTCPLDNFLTYASRTTSGAVLAVGVVRQDHQEGGRSSRESIADVLLTSSFYPISRDTDHLTFHLGSHALDASSTDYPCRTSLRRKALH